MLKRNSIRATLWSVYGTVGGVVFQIIYGMIMARLLTPLDFGLMALATVVYALSKGLIDSGLYQAMIQKDSLARDEYSAVFKVNLFISVCLILIVNLVAPSLSEYYGELELVAILRWTSVVLLFESLTLIQRALLTRDLEFGLITKVDLAANLLSSILAIFVAIAGGGVYSLVTKQIAQSLVCVISFWSLNPINLNYGASFTRSKSLVSFGSRVFLADQIEVVSNQVTFAIVGKQFLPTTLGYFSKGMQYQKLVGQTLIVAVNKVVLSTFSRVQGDKKLLRKGCSYMFRVSSFITFPLMLGSILIGEDLIILLLGDQWTDSAIYFKLFCIGGLTYPFVVFNLNILKSLGLASTYFKVSLYTKLLIVPLVLIGMIWGVYGIAMFIVLHQYILAYIVSAICGARIDYPITNQLADILFYAISAVFSFLLMLLLSKFADFNSIFLGALFLVIYLGLFVVIPNKELPFLIGMWRDFGFTTRERR